MGTWGEKLFADDTAADVRDEWNEELQTSGSAKNATAAVLKSFKEEIADSDDGPVVWLALAVTEHQNGYATPKVQQQARRVLDKKLGLGRWEEQGTAAVRARLKEYDRIRTLLDSPLPEPRKVKRKKIEDSGLRPGQIFRTPLPDSENEFAYFKVIDTVKERGAIDLIVVLLDYPPPNSTPPTDWSLVPPLGLRNYENSSGCNVRFRYMRLWGWNRKDSPRKQVEVIGKFPVATTEKKVLDSTLASGSTWAAIALTAKHSFDKSEWLTSGKLKEQVIPMSMDELRRQADAIAAEVAASKVGAPVLTATAAFFLSEKWDPERALFLWDLAKKITKNPDIDRSRARAMYALGQTAEAERLWNESLARAANPKQRKMDEESISRFKERVAERSEKR